MRVDDDISNGEIAGLICPGIILTIGAVWWISGFAVACLVLGLLLLSAGWACIR